MAPLTAHCSLDLPGSGDPPTSVRRAAGTTGVRHHPGYFFMFCRQGLAVRSRAGIGLLTSSSPPALASQSAGIAGMSHMFQVRSLRSEMLAHLTKGPWRGQHLPGGSDVSMETAWGWQGARSLHKFPILRFPRLWRAQLVRMSTDDHRQNRICSCADAGS